MKISNDYLIELLSFKKPKNEAKTYKIEIDTDSLFIIFDYKLQVFDFFDVLSLPYKPTDEQLEFTTNYLNKFKNNGSSN